MAPIGEAAGADVAAGMGDDAGTGGAGPGGAGAPGAGKKGSYVPPALRGAGGAAGAGAGERMGGKYGERDDLATLRVTNVSLLLTWETRSRVSADTGNDRSPRWRKRTSCAICSSASVGLLASSWPKIATLVWPRALPSSVSQTVVTLLRLVPRWMVSVSGT